MKEYEILVVDQDKIALDLIRLHLEIKGYHVVDAYDGAMAFEQIKRKTPDLVLLDVMLPEIDGFQLIKRVRKIYDIPIIMLSEKSDASEMILGLELGADDFVLKPFNPLEVCARVRAQIRRANEFGRGSCEVAQSRISSGKLQFKSLELDPEKYELLKNGVHIKLTSTELRILYLLMKSPDRVFTKQKIYESVWNDTVLGDENVIMVHMSKLRDKIDVGESKSYINTIRGLGYKMNCTE